MKTKQFDSNYGMHQGNVLFVLLFSLTLHEAIEKLKLTVYIRNKSKQLGTHADDIIIQEEHRI